MLTVAMKVRRPGTIGGFVIDIFMSLIVWTATGICRAQHPPVVCSLHQLRRQLPGSASEIEVISDRRVKITCLPGYIPRDPQILACISGQWNSTGQCAKISCGPPPELRNASITYSKIVYGAIAVYACAEGLVPTGPMKRRCTANGTWDGTEAKCAPFSVSVATVAAIVIVFGVLFVIAVTAIVGVEFYRRSLYPGKSTIRSKGSSFSGSHWSNPEDQLYASVDRVDSPAATIPNDVIEPYAQTTMHRSPAGTDHSALYEAVPNDSNNPYSDVGDRNFIQPYAQVGCSNRVDPLYESLDSETLNRPSRSRHRDHDQSNDSHMGSNNNYQRPNFHLDIDESDRAEFDANELYSTPNRRGLSSPQPLLHTLSPEEIDKLYAKPKKKRKQTNFTVI